MIVTWLSGTGHQLIELGNPTSELLVGLIFHLFPNPTKMIALTQPIVLISDKSEYRILVMGPDTNDYHPREELVFNGEGDNARVKFTERHPPFLG
jgi:hypothetical protein